MDAGPSDIDQLIEKRRAIAPLLSPSDPADALTSYYALWHDPRRTQLTVHYDAQGRADSFVAVCQTGTDLFRPLVTLRLSASSTGPGLRASALLDLLQGALIRNRPYHFVVAAGLAPDLEALLTLARQSHNLIFGLSPARFQPVVNVLVQPVQTPDGGLCYQIKSQGQVVAMSGTNWRSPTFGEVFVYVHPKGRGRGWGRSVVSACTRALVEDGIQPLYAVQEGDTASIHLAEALGYTDSGVREFSGDSELRS